ncbi:MAG TPA: glycosyltransferase [Acidimicrobiales bacterium]|nr:glycosyltransferase [Acidimicrobiales bacterium]
MNDRPRIAFVDREPPSGFMAVDRRCLESRAEVEHLVYPGSITPGFVRSCLAAAARNDLVYAFFASEHALVPALVFKATGRRFLLVPAGYDYANVPEHHYGLAARGRAWLPKLLGRLCDEALPISQQTMWEFLDLVPSAAPRTMLGYLGVDATAWEDPGVARDDVVVTLGYIDDEAWSRKGIDRFVAAAADDPTRRYVLAGRITPEVSARIDAIGPANLERPGRLDHEELRRLFWGAQVYAQLSWHETFGVAMAEAMLCGCVPVVRASMALHEVAGPWAVTVEASERDVDAIARAARSAVGVDRAAMRDDIAERFSLERREQVLAAAVTEALR